MVSQAERQRSWFIDSTVAKSDVIGPGCWYVVLGHRTFFLFRIGWLQHAVDVVKGDVVMVTFAHHLDDAVLILIVDDGKVDGGDRSLGYIGAERHIERCRFSDFDDDGCGMCIPFIFWNEQEKHYAV